MTNLKTFLQGLPSFERFNERQIDALVSLLRVETLAPGTTLLRQNEQGSALYIVMSGTVRAVRKDSSGNEEGDSRVVLAGEMTGFMSLVPGVPSPATCVADNQVTVASLSYENYNTLFLLAPAVAHQFQYMVAVKLANYLKQKTDALTQRLANHAQPSLLERLFGV